MIHDRTYRPVPYAPAPRLQDADGSMRQAPRRSAGHAATYPVQPLKGLPGTRATDVSYRASVPAGHAGRGVALSYRALAPGGAGFCCRICTGTSESRPTAHYSLLTANSTYTFSAKEKDSETGLSYFGSRYYSSDLSVWLSVDPMSDKYPSLSPYTYCADNPVKLTDPDGRWIPGLDEDYNITVTKEEGDDFNSFREFMGPGYSDEEIKNMFDDLQGDKINLTKSYGGVFQRMTNALNNAYGDPEFLGADNYNCWGAALNLTSGYELTKRTSYTLGSGIDTEDKFDELLTKYYTQVSPEMASVGKTVLRYGFTPDVAKHAAIYMGKDRSGNEYVFTKNGWRTPPAISTVGNMLAPGGYGVNCSIGSVNDNNCYGNGYYTSKQPKR